jgi:hypothetical protein
LAASLSASLLAPHLKVLAGGPPPCKADSLVVANLRKGVPGVRLSPHYTSHAPLAQFCGVNDTRLNCTLCSSGWRGMKCNVRSTVHPCTAGTCLDSVRCPPGAPLTVHVYARPLPGAPGPGHCVNEWVDGHASAEHRSVVAALRASPRHTDAAGSACLLVPWFDTLCNGNRCSDTWSDAPKLELLARLAEALPHWGGDGRNHLLFDFSSAHSPSLPIGRGIYAATAFWASGRSYRHGWDFSLPLWDLRWRQSQAPGPLAPSDEYPAAAAAAAAARAAAAADLSPRPLLLSFKGQRMFFCHHKLCAPPDLVSAIRDGGLRPTASYGHSWVRNRLGALHNGQDIVMATQCERELREPAACNATCKARCSTDRLLYESLDYEQLMANSSFALVLPGIAPMSYRLAEAMGFGAIPVIASDFITLPFTRVLDWRRFSVQAAESSLEALPDRLRAIPAEVVADMRREARAAYDRCFASPGQIALCTLDEIEATHLL